MPKAGTAQGKGRPIAELPIPDGTADPDAYRDSKRLAYRAEVPVNWCPALGTVLANEEVIDGKSERGGFPVVRMPLTPVDAPDHRLRRAAGRRPRSASTGHAPSRTCSATGSAGAKGPRSIFRSAGRRSRELGSRRQSEGFPETPSDDVIRVFTTRPDTLFGATYMVLAPEHPLVDGSRPHEQRAAVAAYREQAARKSDLDRTDLAKTKTGVFTGGYAINPVNGQPDSRSGSPTTC